MRWQDTFDRIKRPNFLDIKKYLSEYTFTLFDKMNHELALKHRIKGAPAHYNKDKGWVYPYCIKGIKLFSLYIIDENSVQADDIKIESESDLLYVYSEMDKRCESGFMQKVDLKVQERKERAEKRRMLAQKSDIDISTNLLPGCNPEVFNKYHWISAVPANGLRRLYHDFALGLSDSDLLEDIGLQFFFRCKQGTEEYQLLRSGKVKCHNCGLILLGEDGLIQCQCGYQYTYRGYIASFNEHRMPGGNAQHIFLEYISRWPMAHTDADKMNLIDWLIHQCHVSMSTGLEMRSVLKNLIDAPTRSAKKLILELAYK